MDAVEMIRAAGFDVVEAANADEAILILEDRPDITVVFTDVQMPGLHGWSQACGSHPRTMAAY